jgi:CHAD domain-containing protein
MKQPALFNDYLEKCFDRLQESLEEYNKTGQVKSLFRFRVSIKKIRVCIKCIETYEEKKDFKNVRKGLKKIFRSGGYLRELQLYKDWFRKNALIRLGRILQLDTQIRKCDLDFANIREKAEEIIQEGRKELLDRAGILSQEQVYDFYVDLLKERLAWMLKKSPSRHWHKMRKEFKRILYARHWQEGTGLRLLSNRQAVFLDRLQHLLGYWHDNEAMIAWLKEQQAHCMKSISKSQSNAVKEKFRKALQLLQERGQRYHKNVCTGLDQCNRIMRPLAGRLEKI